MRVLIIAALATFACGIALAQEPPVVVADSPYCARNPFNRDTAAPLPIGLTDWHGADCAPCQFERAGMPQCLRTHAQDDNPRFWGYWVGGGTAFGGGPPCEHDGTWGWDFEGTPSRRIWLNWSHGQRYQGGTGNYKTDGPKLHLHH